jgi:hypothetical protein
VTQISWKAGSGFNFTFFEKADDAINTFFANGSSAYTNHKALIATATIRTHDVRDYPVTDESESNFPLVHVWSGGGGFETTEIESGSYAVRVRTRILVWALNAVPQQAAEDCVAMCGAIASMLQQTYEDAEADDWSVFYANYPLVDISCDPIEFLEDGEGRGLCQGRLNVTWTHNE